MGFKIKGFKKYIEESKKSDILYKTKSSEENNKLSNLLHDSVNIVEKSDIKETSISNRYGSIISLFNCSLKRFLIIYRNSCLFAGRIDVIMFLILSGSMILLSSS